MFSLRKEKFAPLPEIVKKFEGTYKLLVREGDKCIYEQISEGRKHWIAFKVIKRKASKINGKKIIAAEMMPSASHFGTYAWNCLTLEEAYEKFNQLK